MLMHVSEPLKCLVNDVFNLVFRKLFLSVFDELIHILFKEFKDEVKVVVDSNHLFQFNNILMIQLS